MASLVQQLSREFAKEYASTSSEVKLIDSYLVFCILTGLSTILFCVVSGSTFPFNSFLAALWTSLGAFAFGASLRMQITSPDNFSGRGTEAAFREFVLCNLVLFLSAWNYIG